MLFDEAPSLKVQCLDFASDLYQNLSVHLANILGNFVIWVVQEAFVRPIGFD